MCIKNIVREREGMLDLLILLPLFMVGLLNLTFQVSVDEITDVSRKSYFSFRKYEDKGYQEVLDKVSNPEKCQCDCRGAKDRTMHEVEKLWNPSSYDNCPDDTPAICPHGFYFHQRYCRCIPINGEYQKSETRGKPPV